MSRGGFCRCIFPPDADDQQPGAGHHEDERGHHAEADGVETPGIAGKEDDGTGLFEDQAGKAPDGSPQQGRIRSLGRAQRLPDA